MAELYFCIKNICEDRDIECFNSLKNICLDEENSFYLCECESKRFDFDNFTKHYFSSPLPSSVDTILFDEKEKKLYLIECKNQKCSDIDNSEIKKKVKDTLSFLNEISKICNVNLKDYFIFVGIVYNDQTKWKRRICANTIQFGLEYFKEEKLVNEVKTNDIKWFKKRYLRIKENVK